MPSARAMLVRVRRLESAAISPIIRRIGPFDIFKDAIVAGIEAGQYDSRYMPVVLVCLEQWVHKI